MNKRSVEITQEEMHIIRNWRTKTNLYRRCIAAITDGLNANDYPDEEERKAAGNIVVFAGSRRQ